MKTRCIGCGAIIQSTDINKAGYVPEEVLKKADYSHLVCQRCHQIKNYNKVCKNEMSTEQYLAILKKITKTNSLFVYIIDLFNFEATFSQEIWQMLSGKDVILVANKRDLLPKSWKNGKLQTWLRKQIAVWGFKPKGIVLTSGKNKLNIDALLELIDRHRYARNVYVIGCTNVGKSSLINALIKIVGMLDYDLITTSIIPATTLNLIEIPLFEDGILFDTPGLVSDDNLLNYIDAKEYKQVMPKTEIKPGVYQLAAGQSLLISGYACINYLAGDKNSFITYFSNDLPIQRSRYERANDLFPTRVNELFKVDISDLAYENYTYKLDKPADLVIKGLGFIHIVKAPVQISLIVVKGVGVVIRDGITD